MPPRRPPSAARAPPWRPTCAVPSRTRPRPTARCPTAAPYNWTGGYIGVNVGFGGGIDHYNSNINGVAPNGNYYYGADGYPYQQTSPFSANASDGQRSNGVIGGVQVGYNYELGGCGCLGGYGGALSNVVVGVEADFDGTGISSGNALSSFASGFPFGPSQPQYVAVNSQLNYLGTVRGRLGYAFDHVLVYGTGGFAYGDVTSSVNAPGNNISTTTSQFHTGYVFGGGVEVAVTNNVLLRAEYLRAELNAKTISSGPVGYTGYNYNITERPDVNIVRAGLDYKFGALPVAAPPVIARY